MPMAPIIQYSIIELMLDHIQSETLTHLLTSVNLKSHSNFTTLIHPQLWSLLTCGDVVEIQGPPSSGKTHLLYSLLVNCIIPHSYNSTILGGWSKAAVVFDMDGSFEPIRFNHILLNRLICLLPDSHIAKSIAQESLQRLHTFRPTSSAQLAASIAYLPKYHVSHFPRTPIGLVSVDSMSALYWPDRFATECIRTSLFSKEGERDPLVALALHRALNALKLFHTTQGCMIVSNNWGIYPIRNVTPETYKPHPHSFMDPLTISPSVLGAGGTSPFSDCLPPTHCITVSPSPLPRFRPGISLDELKEREADKKEVGEFVGLIRTPKYVVDKFAFRVASNSVLVGS